MTLEECYEVLLDSITERVEPVEVCSVFSLAVTGHHDGLDLALHTTQNY